MTEKARLAGRWLSLFKRVGRDLWKIRDPLRLRRDDEHLIRSEVVDAMLPGKTSKLQVMRGRTLNQHRWVG